MALALDLKWKEPNLSMERGLEEVQHEPRISQHSPCKCGMENVRKKKRKPQIWNPESNGKGSFFFYHMGIDVWADFKMGDDSQALTCKSPFGPDLGPLLRSLGNPIQSKCTLNNVQTLSCDLFFTTWDLTVEISLTAPRLHHKRICIGFTSTLYVKWLEFCLTYPYCEAHVRHMVILDGVVNDVNQKN